MDAMFENSAKLKALKFSIDGNILNSSKIWFILNFIYEHNLIRENILNCISGRDCYIQCTIRLFQIANLYDNKIILFIYDRDIL